MLFLPSLKKALLTHFLLQLLPHSFPSCYNKTTPKGCVHPPSEIPLFPFSLEPNLVRHSPKPLQLNYSSQGHLNLHVAMFNGQVSIFVLFDQLLEYDHSLHFKPFFFNLWPLEVHLHGLPPASLGVPSQSSLLGPLYLPDLQNLEHSKFQFLDLLFFLLYSPNYLRISSSLMVLNTI